MCGYDASEGARYSRFLLICACPLPPEQATEEIKLLCVTGYLLRYLALGAALFH